MRRPTLWRPPQTAEISGSFALPLSGHIEELHFDGQCGVVYHSSRSLPAESP